jgi:hypothetical protein
MSLKTTVKNSTHHRCSRSAEFTKHFETSINYNLPEKILEANNVINHGDTLEFNLDAYRMTYKDKR